MEEQQSAAAKPVPSVGKRMARGAAWMVALRSADRVLGFASMLVLARLLVPADFGLVALGMAVVVSLAAFSEFGFDLALIQKQAAERKLYDTAWTLSLLRGALTGALILLLAQPFAALMGDERLVVLVSVLALTPVLEGFANIGIVEFRKELVFSKEFQYRFSSRLSGVIVTVSLAFIWRDYWALVVGQLTASCLRLILSYCLHPYRPRLSLAAWRDLFHFSKWIFLNAIIALASRRSAALVVGVFLTPASVGLISLSQETTSLVSQAFIRPIKRSFFPGFAKISHDVAPMRDVFLKAYGLTILLSVPLTAGIGLTADIFVPLAFGANWLETIPVIEILAGAALGTSLHLPIRPVLLALNRPEMLATLSIIRVTVLIPALIIGTWSAGLLGTAWAFVILATTMFFVHCYFGQKFLQASAVGFFSRIWRPLASCGVMALAVWWLKQSTITPTEGSFSEQLSSLALVALTGAFVYGTSLMLFWWFSGSPTDSAEKTVLAFVREKRAQVVKKLAP